MGRSTEIAHHNVLLIIPTLGIGGAERAVCSLSQELVRRGHRVWLCHFDAPLAPPFPVGGELVGLDVSSGIRPWWKLLAFRERVRKIRALKKRHAITVSISFLEGADFVNVLSKGTEKVMVSVRSSKLHYESGTGSYQWLRAKILVPLLYRRADYVVVLQKNLAYELVRFFGIPPERIEVIHNHYDVDFIHRQAEEPVGCETDRKVIVCSGRLEPIKGFLEFLDVVHQLKQSGSNAQLWLLGDGRMRVALEEKAATLGLIIATPNGKTQMADVIFFGRQSNPWKYMARADVFVLSSFSESFGNALAEAIILGLPVVSCDCPYGPRELLAGSVPEDFRPTENPLYYSLGILMPIWDGNARTIGTWADTIHRVLTERIYPRGFSQEHQRRMEEFLPDRCLKQWESLF